MRSLSKHTYLFACALFIGASALPNNANAIGGTSRVFVEVTVDLTEKGDLNGEPDTNPYYCGPVGSVKEKLVTVTYYPF